MNTRVAQRILKADMKAWILASTLDHTLTYIAISRFKAEELNPIIRLLIEEFGCTPILFTTLTIIEVTLITILFKILIREIRGVGKLRIPTCIIFTLMLALRILPSISALYGIIYGRNISIIAKILRIILYPSKKLVELLT